MYVTSARRRRVAVELSILKNTIADSTDSFSRPARPPPQPNSNGDNEVKTAILSGHSRPLTDAQCRAGAPGGIGWAESTAA